MNHARPESDEERERSDPDQRENRVADARVHRLDALGDAHGADRAAVVRHGHGCVQEVLAERVAVTFTLRAPRVQRSLDLRTREVGGAWRVGLGRVREQQSSTADDDHAGAELLPGIDHQSPELLRRAHSSRRSRGDDERLRGGFVSDLCVDPPAQG